MTIHNIDEWKPALEEYERRIWQGDGNAIVARWQSGLWLLNMKVHKQLPKGVLEILMYDFRVSRSELTARMKFAKKFRTEEDVTNVISKFKTWFAIKQKALTDTPREKKVTSPLHRIIRLLEQVDSETISRSDFPLLERIHDLAGQLGQALTTREAA